MKIQKRYQGRFAHRYKNNPDERRLAVMFQEMCQRGQVSSTQRDMLDDLLGTEGAAASPEDRKAALTAIQWLASPVGREFLEQAYFACNPTVLKW